MSEARSLVLGFMPISNTRTLIKDLLETPILDIRRWCARCGAFHHATCRGHRIDRPGNQRPIRSNRCWISHDHDASSSCWPAAPRWALDACCRARRGRVGNLAALFPARRSLDAHTPRDSWRRLDAARARGLVGRCPALRMEAHRYQTSTDSRRRVRITRALALVVHTPYQSIHLK
jgi:hypothetical protein